MLASDAALARCEVARIRLVRQRIDSRGHWNETDASDFSLQPVRVGPVQLDCEQSCNVCVSTSCIKTGSDDGEVAKSSWSFTPMPPDPPCWPPSLPDFTKETDEQYDVVEDFFQLAIFWKASVVNDEGHVRFQLTLRWFTLAAVLLSLKVSSVVGETFIVEPLSTKLRIPGMSISSSSALDDAEKEVRMRMTNSESTSLVISCRPIRATIHDFEKNRLCQIPLEVSVANMDDMKRLVDVTLRYTPKVCEAVSSVTQLPPENRQLWWIDREVVKATIRSGECSVFRFVISISQPSVYDVAGSQLLLHAIFDDGETKTFKTQGIQQLLAAEKRAAEKINEARKRKFQRMKQAKQEAQAEVEKYRQERERKFKQYEQTYLGTKEDIESKIRRDTENEIEAMKKNVAAHKQQVIVRLLQLVCDIRPELHHNLILQKKLHGQFS
ncbi:V-type ATPase, G subunit [Necator americanus]|uniref:V-type ATPase, G subunit n=1 Tax=Necator americanus TaxID=51031 RepID=W2TR99_NECAM|nr:V-type ATPase, G subunit [Necator americanus]ETN84580.1 V-type ATPase, G subunit [Necator americanus]